MLGIGLKEVVVLGAYIYVVFKVLKKGELTKKAIATAIALFFLMGPEGFASVDGTDGTEGKEEKASHESLEDDIKGVASTLTADLKEATDMIGGDIKNFQRVSNINTNTVGKSSLDERGGGLMGPKVQAPGSQMPYDGLRFETGNNQSWMKSPDNTSLLPNDTLYTYLGSEGPIKMKISDQAALTGPPVDGVEGSPEKMFMFANNRSSLSCCPSTFSTSTGCICSTENQRDYVAERGGNN
jgi:hypothetical protein